MRCGVGVGSDSSQSVEVAVADVEGMDGRRMC